jgi:hypothetical protein
MYTHVSTCKNDKTKLKTKTKQKALEVGISRK